MISITPARKGLSVIPGDTDLPTPSRMLWIGGTGDLALLLADDTEPVVLKAVPVGMLNVQVKRVLAVGTTAKDIVALV